MRDDNVDDDDLFNTNVQYVQYTSIPSQNTIFIVKIRRFVSSTFVYAKANQAINSMNYYKQLNGESEREHRYIYEYRCIQSKMKKKKTKKPIKNKKLNG